MLRVINKTFTIISIIIVTIVLSITMPMGLIGELISFGLIGRIYTQ